jgi:hypothetical protein
MDNVQKVCYFNIFYCLTPYRNMVMRPPDTKQVVLCLESIRLRDDVTAAHKSLSELRGCSVAHTFFLYVCVSAYMRVHGYLHIEDPAYKRKHMHTRVHTCIHTYIHTYTYVHTHMNA